jgi:CHASE3 domain sensor protein
MNLSETIMQIVAILGSLGTVGGIGGIFYIRSTSKANLDQLRQQVLMLENENKGKEITNIKSFLENNEIVRESLMSVIKPMRDRLIESEEEYKTLREEMNKKCSEMQREIDKMKQEIKDKI